ncbi:hypothetical protein [Ornithinibacillus contaminans]|uniref:hypothetical protein n=1 Tax=Ornithinibacillus contaminans TaxID=694055 RepID=UPI00064D815A|nr:hypothetical protein [Ornithinibacillus contaminans]
MGFRNKVALLLNNQAETAENHWDNELRTHYYKTTKDKGLATLEELIKGSNQFQINSISQEHGEISFHVQKGKKAFIIGTVIMVRPYQTAIDFTVTTESLIPFDFGYSSKLIKRLYEKIDQSLQLVEKIK